MGFKVIRDYVSEKDERTYRGGRIYGDYNGGKHRYKLKDDDGMTYYIVLSDTPPSSNDEDELFAPLDWAERFAGASVIEYKDKHGGYKML